MNEGLNLENEKIHPLQADILIFNKNHPLVEKMIKTTLSGKDTYIIHNF
jgi:hypothetical protein